MFKPNTDHIWQSSKRAGDGVKIICRWVSIFCMFEDYFIWVTYLIKAEGFFQMKLEIACNNFQSAINAARANVDRLELFENINEGGTTPSYGMIKQILDKISTPTYVMIRPRGGNFNYSDEEFEIMKSDIEYCHLLGVKGIVFGILNNKNEVDIERNKILLDLWKYKSATFHRAIDITPNIENACNQIIEIGFNRILTSGGKPTAVEGLDVIKKLKKMYNDKCTIMAGSGINEQNIHLFSGIDEIHATCKTLVYSSNFFGEYYESEYQKILKIKELANNL